MMAIAVVPRQPGSIHLEDVPKPSPDDVPGVRGVLVCALRVGVDVARVGERGRARGLFERLLGFCNDIGLLAEEIDPHPGELVGNFPQAFSHVGLIQAAISVDLPGESMSAMAPEAVAGHAERKERVRWVNGST